MSGKVWNDPRLHLHIGIKPAPSLDDTPPVFTGTIISRDVQILKKKFCLLQFGNSQDQFLIIQVRVGIIARLCSHLSWVFSLTICPSLGEKSAFLHVLCLPVWYILGLFSIWSKIRTWNAVTVVAYFSWTVCFAGGCNTVNDALSLGKPYVAFETDIWFSRVGKILGTTAICTMRWIVTAFQVQPWCES